MDTDIVKEKLAERVKGGKITCAECLAVARDLKIPPNGLAQILTEMDVKIVQCQLSCFP